MDRRVTHLLVALLAVTGVFVATGAYEPFLTTDGFQPTTEAPGGTPTEGAYEQATVRVLAENGTELGAVRVAIADTFQKRYTGLSETESLPENRGMLFTYDEEGNHTYVMRGMDFGIDIVYIGADGRITTIHHAPEPPEGADGNEFRYPGRGQYVLEVNYNWTTRRGIEEGDRVVIER
ncbi:DUF192 domain-containing protein [Natronomonas sp. EA1]|uniref:DUF192 domain-containing protein n=1 Tax=Natronomonas sp. EA1 TaxID=3421655 RepID=UPI003EC01A97